VALGPNPLAGGVIGSAWLKIGADPSGLKQGAAASQQSMLGLGLAAGSAGKQIASMFGKYIGAAALIGAVKSSTAAFIEFDKHLRNTHTLITATETELQKIGKGVRALARDFNVSAAASQASLYQIYSATFYGAEAMHILEEGAKGAVAGLAELKPTVDMLTTVLNAYRFSAEETTHINDLLFTAIRYGKTTLPELSHQFGRLAGVAAPVGASIEDMTAAIATLTRQGIMTDWAITSLRQTLMQFIKPTKNLKDALLALGYESGSAMVKHYGFAGALREITKWAKENNVEMDQMFTNIRAITAVLPLATIAAGEYAKDQERMANAAGAAAVAFAKAERSIAYQLKKFTTLVNDMAISIGKVFVPALMMMVKAVEMLVTPLRKAVEIFDIIGGDYFIAIAAGIGTLIVAVWALHKAFVGLVGIMSGLMASKALMLSVLGAGGGIAGQALKSLLVLGGGSLMMGLGKAAIGGLAGAFAIQSLINFDLKLGEVTGLESVRRGAWSAVQAVLGGAIATAIFGIGALPGAIVAAAGITIKILHEVSVRTAERAATAAEAARATFAAGGGIAQLLGFPIIEGARGLNLFAKALVEADKELANTQENFRAMVDILKEFYVPIEGWHGFITGWRQDFGDISQDVIDFGWLIEQLGDKALEAKQQGEGLIQGLADLSLAFSETQAQTIATIPPPQIFTPFGVAIENISTQFVLAQENWEALTKELESANITTERAEEIWGELGSMANTWSLIAFIAAKYGGDLAKATAEIVKEWEEYLDRSDDVLSAVAIFNNAIASIGTTLASVASQINSTFAALEQSIMDAATLGEEMAGVAGILAGAGNIQAFRENLERVITAPLGEFSEAFVEWAKRKRVELEGAGPTPGKTFAQIAAEQEQAAKTAAREAERAAKEMAQAAQEAFRDEFKKPLLEGIRTGDWKAAADTVIAFAKARKDIMAFAAGLSTANDVVIDEIEVIGLILGAQSNLLSALGNQIKLLELAGEDTLALEAMKQSIEDLLDPLGGFKKKLREILGLTTPIIAGTEIRKLAELIRGPGGRGFQTGGSVAGAGSGDVVPAMLTPGEFVIPKWMMKIPGLSALVFAIWGKKFKVGGPTGEGTTFAAPAAIASTSDILSNQMFKELGVAYECVGGICSIIAEASEEFSETCSTCAQAAQEQADITGQAANEVASSFASMIEGIDTSNFVIQDFKEQILALQSAIKSGTLTVEEELIARSKLNDMFASVIDSAEQYASQLDTQIDAYELLGWSTKNLVNQSKEFYASLQELTPILFDLKNRLKELLSSIGETIKSGLKELIRGFFSAGEAAESLGSSLNVPTGYKVTRAAWAAAAPGIPGIAKGAGEGFSLAEWATNLALEIVGALTDALVDFMWENVITPLIWEDFIIGFLWEDFIVGFLWEDFILPFIWDPIIMPAVEAITGFIASLLSGVATLKGFGAALAGLFVLFTGLGVVIGVVEAGLAFLWGAIQGVGDLLSAFFKPIIEAVGWAWEALTPLIDGARKLFGSLAPIMEIFGEVVAFGIRLITPLFSVLGLALGGIGDVINIVAQGIKLIWDNTLGPVLILIAGTLVAVANTFIVLANVISDIIKFLTFGLVNLGHTNLIALPTLQEGGKILSEGLAYLHTGEIVAPAALTQPLGAGVGGDIVLDNTIMLDGDVLWRGMRKVNRNEERRKTGSSVGGRAWRSG